MDRRSFITAAAAVPLVGVSRSKPKLDQHVAWFTEWTNIKRDNEDLEGGYGEHQGRVDELSSLICTSRPTTAAGAAAQLEYAMADFGDHMIGNVWKGLDHKLFGNLLGALKGGLS